MLPQHFRIDTLKCAELKDGEPHNKWKGRSVFKGNKVVDENSDHALCAEMSSRPPSMEAENSRCARFPARLRHPASRCEASLHPGTLLGRFYMGEVSEKSLTKSLQRHEEGPCCPLETGPLWAPQLRDGRSTVRRS